VSAIGVVTGSRAEAVWLGRSHGAVPVAVSGGDPRLAAAAARRLIEAGAGILVSFGVAGGLDPAARPGDLVAAAAVVATGGRRWPADAAIGAALGARLPDVGVLGGPILGCDRPVTTPAAKARLFAATGAVAVDMESHAIAGAAGARGLIVVRAIADPASRAVPAAALAGLGDDGRMRPGAVVMALARRPGETAALIGLAAEWRAARASLRRAGPLLLGLLGGGGRV